MFSLALVHARCDRRRLVELPGRLPPDRQRRHAHDHRRLRRARPAPASSYGRLHRSTVTQRDTADQRHLRAGLGRDQPGHGLRRDRRRRRRRHQVLEPERARSTSRASEHGRVLVALVHARCRPDADSSSCQVGYRPTADAGTHTITGAYQGSTLHETELGQPSRSTVTTARHATTSVTCARASVAINQGTVLRRRSSTTSTPGHKSEPGRHGRLPRQRRARACSASPSCTLAAHRRRLGSSCQVGYRPTADAGTRHVSRRPTRARACIEPSSGTFAVTVTSRDTDDQRHLRAGLGRDQPGHGLRGRRRRRRPRPQVQPDRAGRLLVRQARACSRRPRARSLPPTPTRRSCQVGYRPTADAGTHTITGAYQGSTLHQPSSGTFAVTVTTAATRDDQRHLYAGLGRDQPGHGLHWPSSTTSTPGQRSSRTGPGRLLVATSTGVFSVAFVHARCHRRRLVELPGRLPPDRQRRHAHDHRRLRRARPCTRPRSGTFAADGDQARHRTPASPASPASVAINQGTVCAAAVDDVDAGQQVLEPDRARSTSQFDEHGRVLVALVHARCHRLRLVELPGRLPPDRRRRHAHDHRRLPGLDPAPDLARTPSQLTVTQRDTRDQRHAVRRASVVVNQSTHVHGDGE